MKTRATIVGLILVWSLPLAFVTPLEAFSVGDIVVQSHRGMPFLAEIPLTLNDQERGRGVLVTLGDADEYRAEGLSRPTVIESLEASWLTGARDVILIASTVPVPLASFDLVLLVRSGPVTIVRAYHVGLAEPPAAAPRAAIRPPTPPRSAPQKVATAPVKPPTPPQTVRTPTIPAWIQALPARYGPVKRGGTLYSVAQELNVPGNNIWQAIVLLWQANQEQFSGGNMHGLRSGVLLTVPTNFSDKIASMTRQEAQKVVAEQWETWQALRQAVSGQQAVTAAQTEPSASAAIPATPAATPAPASTPPPPRPSASVSVPAAEASTPAAPEPPARSTVVLPAGQASAPAHTADVQTMLRGLEQLLAQRMPQTGDVPGPPQTFVKSTELQAALQGLEERLSQQLQETLQQVKATQRATQRAAQPVVKQETFLEQLLPQSSMLYVLVVENALLLLLAVAILWRWMRSRA
jgi:pilus assembly protein FimV